MTYFMDGPKIKLLNLVSAVWTTCLSLGRW